MVIEYNGRKLEITNYEFFEGGLMVHEANYIDGDMRDLESRELMDLERTHFDAIYEKIPKGTGY